MAEIFPSLSIVAVDLRVSSMSVTISLTKKSRRVTSLPTSRRKQKRRTPSGRTCTSTLRGSLKESAPSERSPLTSVSSSWSICRQHRRYTALTRNCTPTLLQVIGQLSVLYSILPIVTTKSRRIRMDSLTE